MVGSLEFVVVLLALYLLECLRTTRPDELIIDRRLWSGFRVKRPVLYPSNGEWGWVLLNPFRPDGPMFSMLPASYAITRFGILAFASASSPEAGAAVALEGELSGLTDDERAVRAREHERRRLDVADIRRACEELEGRVSTLRDAAPALLALCLVVFPACVFLFGLRATLVPALAVVVVCSAGCAVLYHRAATALPPPTLSKISLWGKCTKLVLYPVAALRCVDLLTSDVLRRYDPIAVTTVLCGKEDGAKLLASEMVHLRFRAIDSCSDGACHQAMEEYRCVRMQLLELFAIDQGFSLSDLAERPPAAHHGARTYCPGCRAQYRLPEGLCTDCSGMILQPLAKSRETAAGGRS